MELCVWSVNILSFHVTSQNHFCYLGFGTRPGQIFPFKAVPFQLRCWKAQALAFPEQLSREHQPNLGIPTVPKNIGHKDQPGVDIKPFQSLRCSEPYHQVPQAHKCISIPLGAG